MAVVDEVDFNLHAAVFTARDEVGSDDLDEIVLRLKSDLPEEIADKLLSQMLRQTVRRCIARDATKVMDGPRSSKWAAAAEVAWEVELLRTEIMVRGRPKPIGKCDARDLVDLANERKLQAEQNLRREKQFKALAATLQKLKLSTVADVPVDILKKIFDA